MECRKRALLGDSFSPRNKETFPGVTFQMCIIALQAFVIKRTSCFSWELYLLPLLMVVNEVMFLVHFLPFFITPRQRTSNFDSHERPFLRKGSVI